MLALAVFTGSGLLLSVLEERVRRVRWAEAVTVTQQQQVANLSRLNDQLARQSEELAQQNEELGQQSEELAQQNEGLRNGRRSSPSRTRN